MRSFNTLNGVPNHHGILSRPLRQAEQRMNILHTSESLLVQLELYGDVELLKSQFQMPLKRVRIREVDCVELALVFCGTLDRVK